MIVIIDNYDSFVYNIYHLIDKANKEVQIFRNDKIAAQDIKQLNASHIIISPGPMAPKQSGCSMEVIKEFYKTIPILGICLGHQAIGEVFNCNIIKSNNPIHGQMHNVILGESLLYKNLPNEIHAGRYHSLIISNDRFNHDELQINATLKDGTIMGVQHKQYPLFGTQFHPESILTEQGVGSQILKNFLEM